MVKKPGDEENERALAIVESLMEKGERDMTPEEDALLDLLQYGGGIRFAIQGRAAGNLPV